MSIRIVTFFLSLLLVASCGCNTQQEQKEQSVKKQKPTGQVKELKIQSVEVVSKIEHDPKAFTQGLYFYDGFLYESTGLRGESTLRKLDPRNGKVIKSVSMEPNIFSEGITVFDDKIYMISWTNGLCMVFDPVTFKKEKEFRYSGEGWGLTHNSKNLFMTDGSNLIKVIKPDDFSVQNTISVVDNEMNPVFYLNELENIKGEIWANIWQNDKLVKINPADGNITAWIDLSSLRKYLQPSDRVDVLNGIAWDPKSDKIYVTGKYWPYIFEIKVIE